MSKHISSGLRACKLRILWLFMPLLPLLSPTSKIWCAANPANQPADLPLDALNYFKLLVEKKNTPAYQTYVDALKDRERSLIQMSMPQIIAIELKQRKKKEPSPPNTDPRDPYWDVIIDLIKADVFKPDHLTDLSAEDTWHIYQKASGLPEATMQPALESAVRDNLGALLVKEKAYDLLHKLLAKKIAQFPISRYEDDKEEIKGWGDILVERFVEGDTDKIEDILTKGYLEPYKINWALIFEKKKDFASNNQHEKDFMKKENVLALPPDVKQDQKEEEEKKKAAHLVLVAQHKQCWSAAEHIISQGWAGKNMVTDLDEYQALDKWQGKSGAEKNFWKAYITFEYEQNYTSDDDWTSKIKKKTRSDTWKLFSPLALLITLWLVSLWNLYIKQIKPRIKRSLKPRKDHSDSKPKRNESPRTSKRPKPTKSGHKKKRMRKRRKRVRKKHKLQ